MSTFEIKFTPPSRAKSHRQNADPEKHEPIDVVMAPFSRKSVVQFDEVPVQKTAKRILRISNPTSRDLKVYLENTIKPQLNLNLEWVEKTIPAGDFVSNQLVWSPLTDISCREDLRFTDERNFSKIVMVILKTKAKSSKSKPQQIKNVRKFPNVTLGTVSRVKTTRLKTPSKNLSKSSRTVGHPSRKSEGGFRKGDEVEEDETEEGESPDDHDDDKGRYQLMQTSPLRERNLKSSKGVGNYDDQSPTRFIKPQQQQQITVPRGQEETMKENVSPLAISNVLNMIDELQFTPACTPSVRGTGITSTTDEYQLQLRLNPQSSSSSSFASSLCCTPIQSTTYTITSGMNAFKDAPIESLNAKYSDARDEDDRHFEDVGLKPRSLNSALMHETITIAVTEHERTYTLNKTNLNTENTAAAKSSNRSTGDFTDELLTNKTIIAEDDPVVNLSSSPTVKYLDIIQEEESSLSSASASILEKPSNPVKCDNRLKRDVKLVGKPLRKHSESMKDLLNHRRGSRKDAAGQGSLPNLNEMDVIKDFENNRYLKVTEKRRTGKNADGEEGEEEESEFMEDVRNFGCDILAQSSVFNLNEIDRKKSQRNEKELTTFFRKPITPSKTRQSLMTKKISSDYPQDMESDSVKRRLHELSLSDVSLQQSLESNKSNHRRSSIQQRKQEKTLLISPPKRQRLDTSVASGVENTSTSRKNWLKKQPKTLKLMKTLKLIKPTLLEDKRSPIKLYDSDLYLQACINPDPFAATTTCDPFLTSTMYLNDMAVERHEIDFKKWLNALVAIPADLDTNSSTNVKIDVAKLFNDARNKDLILPPTKEQQSIDYLTTFRLESLRRAAIQLFMSGEMRIVCSKIAVYIQKGSLRIRNDRNLHLDFVTQRDVLELLLNFNPLWLRLGLEVVYGEKINLQSNADVIGLSTFILHRLFRDKYLEQKNSRAYTLSAKYSEYIKKFTLQKIIFLLLFLDKAKQKRIITHNPCLFVAKSPFKETREILLRFSSELLANVGDITRELGRLGYQLTHKQTYLDEFNYAFNNLAIDLRDGVRLTRVMEIILLRDDLTMKLRVPAISRLQRVYNVNVALKALNEADFQLKGEIVAQDIVDGHREKTLSLLWQIIYKFRSPKFHAAARSIQKWWRNSCWLRITIRRRIERKLFERQNTAALQIQRHYRGYRGRKYAEEYRRKRLMATITLQRYIRGYLARKQKTLQLNSIHLIQNWYRNVRLCRRIRNDYIRLRKSVCLIQEQWRRRIRSRQIRTQAYEAKQLWLNQRHMSCIRIQSYWRSFRLRRIYQRTLRAIIVIQRIYRGYREMSCLQQQYRHSRELIIKIQRRYRATRLMRQVHNEYQVKRQSIILIQRFYRAHLLRCRERHKYLEMRQQICFIQGKWRAILLSRQLASNYQRLRYYTIQIQRRFRANRLMKSNVKNYRKLYASIIHIQRVFRSKLQMRKDRQLFVHKVQSILLIQRTFRAYKSMRYQRAKYQGIRNAVECLQIWWRECLIMRRQRNEYQLLRTTTIFIQRRFRQKLQMRVDRKHFLQLRQATICLQQHYRCRRAMLKQMELYGKQRESCIRIQRYWRNLQRKRQQRDSFLKQMNAIIFIQRRYHAKYLMRVERHRYLEIREKVIYLQCRIRLHYEMCRIRESYQCKRKAILRIQSWYRSLKQSQQERTAYLQLKSHTIQIQRKWRAKLLGRKERQIYLHMRQSIISIQRLYRSQLLMKLDRQEFLRRRNAALQIQRYYRNYCKMLNIREQYRLIRTLVICIQQRYRAKAQMLVVRRDYLRLREATILVQRKYRGLREMRLIKQRYQYIHKDILVVQSHARGLLARRRYQTLMTPEMREMLRQRKAAQIIQRYWRGYRVRKRFSNIQMKQIRQNIVHLKESTNIYNTIRFKLFDAVRILRGRSSASDAINVLKRLDRISRTVPHVLIQHADFIATFCYGIMAQAIRSEIDKHLIMYCCRIILNLARYNSTTVHAFQQGGLVTIAQILLRWCDKDCEIFNTLCTLVWVFAHCPNKCKVIREFMTTSEALYMVRETSKLVARKEKMKQNLRKPLPPLATGCSSFIANSSMNVSLHQNAMMSGGSGNHHSQQQNFSNRALPSLDPDYGVIHKKPYTFISSVFAFNTLLAKLGISIY